MLFLQKDQVTTELFQLATICLWIEWQEHTHLESKKKTEESETFATTSLSNTDNGDDFDALQDY